MWQSGETDDLENSNPQFMQMVGVSAPPNQTLVGSHPICIHTNPAAHLPPAMQGLAAGHQPGLFPAALGHHKKHAGDSLPFVILLPIIAGRSLGKEVSRFHPPPPLLLLMSWTLASSPPTAPEKYLLPVFLRRPPEASFFMNKR